MFESATIKLTGWYLLIIMVVSLLFSVLVHQSALGEVRTRLNQFGQGIVDSSGHVLLDQVRDIQINQASKNILIQLAYINLVVLIGGGVASYLLARRTLAPLEEAHEAQSRFTSDASHELRTPLAAMKTELEVALRSKSLTKPELRELLSSSLEEVDKLTQLSQTLLALSRLDINAISTESLNLPDIIREVTRRMKLAPRRYDYDDTQPLPEIIGNRASITELITILLDNAVKYSPAPSKIRIAHELKGQRCIITVANDGAGIASDDLPHIFKRFYRADTARTNGTENGYGLGLSIAERIVSLHDGTISATSSPHHETVFTVNLPLAQPPKSISPISLKS